jgi:excisionase family DNA binding protein
MGTVSDRLMSPADIAAYLGVKTRTILQWAAEGRLPRPVRLSKKVFRFRQSEVEAAVKRLAVA